MNLKFLFKGKLSMAQYFGLTFSCHVQTFIYEKELITFFFYNRPKVRFLFHYDYREMQMQT
jgi:hypothetical protein